MGRLDAPLGEVACVAEVLSVGSTGEAVVVIAGPAYHRDDEVTHFDPGRPRADFDHFAEGLVSDDYGYGREEAPGR